MLLRINLIETPAGWTYVVALDDHDDSEHHPLLHRTGGLAPQTDRDSWREEVWCALDRLTRDVRDSLTEGI